MSFRKDYIINILENFKSDYGAVLEINDTSDKRFILVFRDNAANLSERQAVTDALMYITRNRTIRLVGCDGGVGNVDTSWLSCISDKDLADKIINSLFEDMKITPGEYCHVYAPVPFTLFGLEDIELYKRAQKAWADVQPLMNYVHDCGSIGIQKFGEDHSQNELSKQLRAWEEFVNCDKERGLMVVKNLLNKMSDMEIDEAALICQGNLPDYVSSNLKSMGISYARVKPRSSSKDNWKPIDSWFKEQLKSKDELFGELESKDQ